MEEALIGPPILWMRNRSDESGAAAVQYAALVVLAALILGALLVVAVPQQVGDGVTRTLCKIFTAFQGDCANTTAQKKLPYTCTTDASSSRLQVYGSVKVLTAGFGNTDQINTTTDPNTGKKKSEVGIGTDVEVDAGGKLKTEKLQGLLDKFAKKLPKKVRDKLANNLEVTGKAGVTGGVHYLYDFNDPKKARKYLKSRHGSKLDRYTSIPWFGGFGGLFPEYAHPIRRVSDWLQGKHPDNRPADGFAITLDGKAEGGGKFDNKKEGPMDSSAGVGGGLEAKLDVGGRLAFHGDGSIDLSKHYTGDFNAAGSAKLVAPLFGKQQIAPHAGFKGTLSYKVKFDQHGQPSKFTVTTEHREHSGLHSTKNQDQLTQTTRVLDLSDPQNAQALAVAASDLISAPTAGIPLQTLLNRSKGGLLDRLLHNSIEVQNKYHAKWNDDGGHNFVVAGNKEHSEQRHLKSSKAIDNNDPSAHWMNLKKCLK